MDMRSINCGVDFRPLCCHMTTLGKLFTHMQMSSNGLILYLSTQEDNHGPGEN